MTTTAIADDRQTYQNEAETLERETRDNGRTVTRRDAADILDLWNRALEHGADRLNAADMRFLAVRMRANLAVRDMILTAVIAGDLEREQLIGIAANPHGAATSTVMERALSNVWSNPDAQPDPVKCANAIQTALAIAARAPEPWSAQPYAVAAYAAWLTGDPDADDWALRALAADEQCSLAAMVAAAVRCNLKPTRLKHR